MNGIIRCHADREQAISLGTALLASDVIGIRQTAPYSIAVFQRDPFSGEPYICYSLQYKEDIDLNTAYYPVKEDGGYAVTFLANNAIEQFVINKGRDDRTAMVVPLRSAFRDKLNHLVENENQTAVIGFSLDASEVLRVHVGEYDLFDRTITGEHVIELSRFNELFDTSVVKTVSDYRRKRS